MVRHGSLFAAREHGVVCTRSDNGRGLTWAPNRSSRFAVRSVQHHGSRVGCMVYRQFEASGSLRRGKWHRNGSRLPNKMKIFRVRDEKKKDKNKHRAQRQQSSDNPLLSLSNSPRRDSFRTSSTLHTNASLPPASEGFSCHPRWSPWSRILGLLR
ncbi:hypothetical protein CGRA01v4_02128 [Colletotrichum graminicola]|nr:hypothetical protein CGRA01v4_02128 [Colletotrichum graminicola]